MAATYDATLSTDRDWVRFLVGDTDVTTSGGAELQDEEIDALVVEEANKYLAAARALSILSRKWASAGKGVMEKRVDDLHLKRGIDQTAGQAIESRIEELRAHGAHILTPSPRMFKAL